MKLGNAVHESLPWVRTLHDVDAAWNQPSDRRQVDAVEDAGRGLGEDLRAGAKVAAVRTLDLTTLVSVKSLSVRLVGNESSVNTA